MNELIRGSRGNTEKIPEHLKDKKLTMSDLIRIQAGYYREDESNNE